MSVAATHPAASTLLLLRLRWRMIRSRWVRVGVVAMATAYLLSFVAATSMGSTVVTLAQQFPNQAAGIYARAWADTLAAGQGGLVAALAVGGSLAIAIFAPFTGSATISLVPPDDYVSIRPHRAHRFYDALVLNAISGIGLLQLLALTGVASLLTLDGQQGYAFAFAWALWVAVVTFTATVGFAVEWLQRRWGALQRRALVGVLAGGAAVAVYLDPLNGTTLFGLSDKYARLMRLSVFEFHWGSVIAVGAALASALLAVPVGRSLANRAMSLQPPARNGSAQRRDRRLPSRPFLLTVGLLFRVFVRTKEIRRPLVAITALGVPLMAFTPLSASATTALPLTVPLAVALGWGVNLFGVLGTGMTWLAAQPHIMSRLPLASFLLQCSASFAILTLLWSAAWTTGRLEGVSNATYFLAAAIASLGTAALSTLLSVTRPHRAPLSGNGDALVPPFTALAYLGVLVVGGCLPAALLIDVEGAANQTLLTVAALSVACATVAIALLRWRRPEVRAHVVAVAGAD